MAESARTERAEYLFVVKEFDKGTPWIMLEPHREGLAEWSKRVIGLDLRPGTTMEEAQEIARVLNDNVTTIGLTDLSSHSR